MERTTAPASTSPQPPARCSVCCYEPPGSAGEIERPERRNGVRDRGRPRGRDRQGQHRAAPADSPPADGAVRGDSVRDRTRAGAYRLRARAARRRAWRREDADGDDACAGDLGAVPAHSADAGSAARRHPRHAHLRREDRDVPDRAGAGLHEHPPRGRDQPRDAEDAERAARGDAGAAGDARRHDLPARGSVLGARDAEPGGAGGRLQPARGAARSLLDDAARRLSRSRRKSPHAAGAVVRAGDRAARLARRRDVSARGPPRRGARPPQDRGLHRAPRPRGAGFDFDEHQPYRPGDDVRRIDWNVTARMNAPYVRHTHAERELNVMIALDVSRSMELGESHFSKKEVLTFMTGSLLFSALSDQINTGFMAFGDRVVAFNQPRRTRGAAWAVLEHCWSLAPQPGPTAILPAIRHLVRTLKKTSVVFLVSDFITGEDLFASRDLALLSARHDVIAVVPEDAAETTLPAGRGYVHVRDLESGRDVAGP